MRKRDCAFLTYLQTGYATATKWMTFKNQRTKYFSLRAVITMQMRHKISEVTAPNYTKFVAVVFLFHPRC